MAAGTTIDRSQGYESDVANDPVVQAAVAAQAKEDQANAGQTNVAASSSGRNGKISYGAISQLVDPAAFSQSPQAQATQNIIASDTNNVIGSEFGEVDRPGKGSSMAPWDKTDWSKGKWGHDITGTDNEGIALPEKVLRNYGDYNKTDFADNFNSMFDVVVSNPQTGSSTLAPLKDFGPGQSTGAGIDLLSGTRAKLGYERNFKGPTSYQIVPKGAVGDYVGSGQASAPTNPIGSLSPWDFVATQLDQTPQNVTVGTILQAQQQQETGKPGAIITPAGAGPGAVAGLAGASSELVAPSFVHPNQPHPETRPGDFGMRIATADDVKLYDQYIANGNDPKLINPYDLLAINLYKDPKFLLKKENLGLLQEMVLNPIDEQKSRMSTGERVTGAVVAAGQGLWGAAGDVVNYFKSEATSTIPSMRYVFAKVTGQVPDQEAQDAFAGQAALHSHALGKTVADLTSFVGGIAVNAQKLDTNIALAYTSDPAKRADILKQYAQVVQDNARGNDQMYDLGTHFQAMQAQVYSWLGGTADMAQKIKTAQPDPSAVSGLSTLYQLLLPEGAGLLTKSGIQIFRPMMTEMAIDGLEKAAVTNTVKYAYDRAAVVPPKVAEEAANVNYQAGRTVQSKLAPDARVANQAAIDAQNDLATKLTSHQKMGGDPGAPTQFVAAVANKAGDAADTIGKLATQANEVGDRLLNRLSNGSPTARRIIDKAFGSILFGVGAHTGHAFMGRALEMVAGELEGAPLEKVAQAASAINDTLKIYGREKLYGETTVPFWTRFQQGTKLMGPRTAAMLDSPAIQALYRMGKGTAAGTLVGGVTGAISDPEDPLAGAASMGMLGGILGMAGSGFSQWTRFKSPGDFYQALRGDWKRTSDMFGAADKAHFLSLQPKDQLMIGTFAQQHPGLRIKFTNDPAAVSGSFAKGRVGVEKPFVPSTSFQDVPEWAAVPPGGSFKMNFETGKNQARWDTPPGPEQVVDKRTGKAQTIPGPEAAGVTNRPVHYFDEANRPTVEINVANPESTIRALFAHEVMHGIESSGMLPDLYDTLLGNPERGTKGQYTALDAKGEPLGINPDTGRYITNQDFANHKNQYIRDLSRTGEPTGHLSDLDIAKELHAEHGVDYMLSNKGYVDSTSAYRPGWTNSNALKKAFANLGFTFDDNGGLVAGTSLFENVKRNDAVDKLTQKYLQKRLDERKVGSEADATRRFKMSDLATGNAADTFLDTAPEIMRNPDGSVMRDKNTNAPIMRPAREVKQYNAKLASDIHDRIAALPEDRKAAIAMRPTGENSMFLRYLPNEVIDGLAKTNEYNPHQIAGLRALSEMLADNERMGTNFRLFNHKALSEGKRYGSFSGTEKFVVPYGLEVTKADNVVLRSVEFQQLTDNFIKNAKRAPYSKLWKDPGEFTQDVHTYFENHAANRTGDANGIGIAKKDAINSLMNFGTVTQREMNPLVEGVGKGTRPIIKSFRIDRISQITPLEKTSPFTDEAQYRKMNMNFRPRRGVPAEGAAPEGVPPEANAIPVTMRTTATGKTVPTKIDYGITRAPLVADKQPTGPLTDNNFGHIDFLTKPDQQKLTHLDKASAVTSYADKLVEEFGKWKDNKEVMSGKTWYKKVRGYLKTAFGQDEELFAHLLAATSPQQGVVQNWHDAFEAYHRYKAGAFDDAIAKFKQTGKITEDMKPTKADGAKFGLNSDAVLKVVAGTWLDSAEGPKAPNFFANLFGRGKEATIDKWAARTMRRLGFEGVEGAPAQYRLTPPSEPAVSNLDFGFSQQAFRQAADRLKMDPHELQAVMWYAEKHHWAEKGYSKGGAAAAKASYIPMLKAYAESVAAAKTK